MDGDYSSSGNDDSRAEGDDLISVMVYPFLGDPFTLEGRKFRLSDTFCDIRAAILDQVSPDHYVDLYEFNDPRTDILKLCGDYFPLEDNWTIASVFDGNTSIDIHLCPAAMERLETRLPRPETRPPDLPDSDVAGDHHYHDSFTRRPRTETLPFCAATTTTTSPLPVVYDGPLELKTSGGEPVSLDELEYCGSLSTSASHVLLTPCDRIWGILSALNQDSKYLIIHIGWDRLSFLFLRVIKLFYPDMPFVAVTDLTPHQLDLLTFLDTPPQHVKYLYGWDVYEEADDLEEADDFGVDHILRLNIKWLYIRPSDLECFPANVSDYVVLPLPCDFDNVLSKIEWNPHFHKNQVWVRELNLFKENRKCVMFKPLGPLINLLSKRLREMDYV